MADKMTKTEAFFSFPSKINGTLFSGVNKSIAQGNNQQMEYAKWNSGSEVGKGQKVGGQTKTDRERLFNI